MAKLPDCRPDETVRWLHISDLHLGQPGKHLWEQARGEFEHDLERMIERVRASMRPEERKDRSPIDLVLFTGDLAFSGKKEEYDDLVDLFLDDLLELITDVGGGATPLVVPVPGNHDVRWPNDEDETRYGWLRMYDSPAFAKGREQLWEKKNPDQVAHLFEAYQAWRARRIDPSLTAAAKDYHPSFFPGDFRLCIETPNKFHLGIVGLNSAWVQYTHDEDDEFKGALVVAPQQLQAALTGPRRKTPLAMKDWCHRALLLMHHPVDWLSPTAIKEFEAGVYSTVGKARFAACLHGHQHEGSSVRTSSFGGHDRTYFEAPSLFGLEHYGKAKESRSFGYALGAIRADGEIRVWPRRRRKAGDGSHGFDVDGRYANREDDDSVVLRRADPDAASSGGHAAKKARKSTAAAGIKKPSGPSARAEADYRDFALDTITRIELIGVAHGGPRFPLDDVYVPLGVSARAPHFADGDGECDPRHFADAHEREGRDVGLESAFEVAGPERHLIVFGEPGSGKTTALRKLAHVVLSEGGGVLGLPDDTIPVFLRLRQLRRAHLKRPLHTLIQREMRAVATGRFSGEFAERLWDRGNLLLLLDGLDEIADDKLRADVCTYLDAQLAGVHRQDIRAVVSCRYAGYGDGVGLSARFLHMDVRPLDDEQIASLIHAWFRAARKALELDPTKHDEVVRRAGEEAADLVEKLGQDAYSSQQIKVLVSTPLLLVLLCVQVMRGHVIPKRRVDFYARCLDVLLESKIRERDEAQLLERADTLDVLLAMAWHLHDAGRRDDLTSDGFAEVATPTLDRVRRNKGEAPAADALLSWLQRGAGVITRYAQDQYGFMHLGLQEYLAAVHAAKERSGGLLARMASQLDVEWWHEPILLTVGLSEHQAFVPLMEAILVRGDLAEHLDLLRRALSEAHAPDPAPFATVVADDGAEPAQRAAVLRLFADRDEPAIAQAASDAGLMEHEDGDLRALARQVCERAGLPVPAVEPTEEEVAAGVPGPRREKEDVIELLPGMRALWVPGGTFTMGGDPKALNARAARQVEVSPFWLGETPVTNAQYKVFLKDAGYKEPSRWRDRRFSDPKQPVVAVTWHDAVKFCEWLGERSGHPVALPTEPQWEFAARGLDGRHFPWGEEEPDEKRACFGLDYGKDKPAPVGSFPAGRGPFGHLDLAGLVWEWTADDVSEEFGGSDRRSLRGGCWGSSARYLRSAARSRHPAGSRYDGVGFRVLCASPPSTVSS